LKKAGGLRISLTPHLILECGEETLNLSLTRFCKLSLASRILELNNLHWQTNTRIQPSRISNLQYLYLVVQTLVVMKYLTHTQFKPSPFSSKNDGRAIRYACNADHKLSQCITHPISSLRLGDAITAMAQSLTSSACRWRNKSRCRWQV
jgi:hypothetical protein